MSVKTRGVVVEAMPSRRAVPRSRVLLLCLGSFCAGMFFTDRMWTSQTPFEDGSSRSASEVHKSKLLVENHVSDDETETRSSKPRETADQALDSAVPGLELNLAAARAAHESLMDGYAVSQGMKTGAESASKRKYLMVIGVNTAFSSRKRREAVRATWMPQGDQLRRLEEEKGVVIRFVIGRSLTPGGVLDQAVEAEEKQYGDFLRLEHVEGYLRLSAKTKKYFATAVTLWDAEFYVKVDDDIHVNIGALGRTLAQHRSRPRVYVGCMKSGPVLARKGVKYHEPEHWKFGEEGNRYFRHATGQLYAISRDLALYIRTNQKILHEYANEDVSLGSWIIGLEVEHVDDKRMCCPSPPICQWKAQAGSTCVATFDWRCSGLCKAAERMRFVHQSCGESENDLWGATF
uniref:Hexosyltransferase n=1 Tax=Kalanchoe fedtschenkoi TaxID=63787 RepID=A0A7N0TNA9_KALFE